MGDEEFFVRGRASRLSETIGGGVQGEFLGEEIDSRVRARGGREREIEVLSHESGRGRGGEEDFPEGDHRETGEIDRRGG